MFAHGNLEFEWGNNPSTMNCKFLKGFGTCSLFLCGFSRDPFLGTQTYSRVTLNTSQQSQYQSSLPLPTLETSVRKHSYWEFGVFILQNVHCPRKFLLVLWEFCTTCFGHTHLSPNSSHIQLPFPLTQLCIFKNKTHKVQCVLPIYSYMGGLPREHGWLSRG